MKVPAMHYHAIDADMKTPCYAFLYDWSAWQSLVGQDPDLPNRPVCVNSR